jgi:hypothetical protein
MPLTKSGEKVMASMKAEYGEKKGKEVFYASINKGKKGSSKWHGKKANPNERYDMAVPGSGR